MRPRQRVLVVDFDPDGLARTAALLGPSGAEIVTALSIPQVLDALAKGAPSAVVIEPVLEGHDGFELCRSIVSLCASKPVMILASRTLRGKEHHFRAKEVGAHLFLERPSADPHLLRGVELVLADAWGTDTSRHEERNKTSAIPLEGPQDLVDMAEDQFNAWIDRSLDRLGEAPIPEATAAPARGGSALAVALPRPRTGHDARPGGPSVRARSEIQADSKVAPPQSRRLADLTASASPFAEPTYRAPAPASAPGTRGGLAAHPAARTVFAALLAVAIALGVFLVLRLYVGEDESRSIALSSPSRLDPRRQAPAAAASGSGGSAPPGGAITEEPPNASEDLNGAAASPPTQRPVGLDSANTGTWSQTDSASIRPSGREDGTPAWPGASLPISGTGDARPAPAAVPASDQPSQQENSAAERPDPPGASAEALVHLAPAGIPAQSPTPLPQAEQSVDNSPSIAAEVEPGQAASEGGDARGTGPDETLAAEAPGIVAPVTHSDPRLITRVDPVFPSAARVMGRGGSVLLSAVVGVDGRLKGIKIVSEPSGTFGLGSAAQAAVRHWRYEPARENNKPTEVSITIRIEFKP